MMIRPIRTGLSVGLTLALWHAVWLLCVALGFAQPLLDWIFWMHLIQPVYTVKPFAAVPAVSLLAVTTVVGFCIGSGFAVIWNRLHAAQPGVRGLSTARQRP